MAVFAVFKLYVDDELKYTKYVSDDKPFRLPKQYKGRRVRVSVTGTAPVTRIKIATSMEEIIAAT